MNGYQLEQSFDNFQVEETQQSHQDYIPGSPVIIVEYRQSRLVKNYEWAVRSLDIVLGSVGGLKVAIGTIITWIVGNY